MPDNDHVSSSWIEYRRLILEHLARLDKEIDRMSERHEKAFEAMRASVNQAKHDTIREITDLKESIRSDINSELKAFDERVRPLEQKVSNIYATASGLGIAASVIMWLVQFIVSKFIGGE